MKKIPVILSIVSSVAFLFLVTISYGGDGGGGVTPNALPASLDSFYPPKAGQPLYLLNMLAMDNLFLGIAVDVMEDDLQGARGNYEEFKSRYLETLEMIPEWREYFLSEPVEKLGTELKEGDKGKVMSAFGEVGKICHECHISNMVKVQQKYHWGDFGGISVKDPLSKELTDYSTFKQYLATSMAGISVNLRQGQTENARRQFAGFKERFQALKTVCLNCHDQERRYFIDDSVTSLLDELGQTLDKQPVDLEAVMGFIQGIGRESCAKCHLVHVPAAFAEVR